MKRLFTKAKKIPEKGKSKLQEIQRKPWAEPAASALNITGTIINSLGASIPGIGFLGGALKVGSAILNPDVKLADLRRTEDALSAGQKIIMEDIKEVQTEVKQRFREVAQEMKKISSDVERIGNVVNAIFSTITEIHYKDGPEKVEAMYQMFLDGSCNLENTFELFKGYAAEAQVNYNQHLRPEKVLNYMKLIKEKQVDETCHDFFAYILMIHGKYLQIMSLFFIFNDSPDQIGVMFERFNKDFSSLQYSFEKIMKRDLQFIPAANISEDTLEENQHAHDLCEISKKESFDEKIQKIKTLVPFSERKNTGQKGNGVGIDLGTTYCCAAIVRNGKVEIIPNERGNPITPSFVGFMNDEVFIGDSAKARITQSPQNTLFDAKSMIGRTSEQLKTSKLINHWPFDLIDFNGEPFYKVLIRGEISVLSSTEVSAMLLRKMKMIAEDYLEEEVTDAVITVPAPFNIQQKHATVEAGRMAGFNVLRILNEPTAAAFASEENINKNKEERKVLVFDLGGGSLDVAVITIEEDIYEIMATAGNLELGGENFDNRLVQHLIKEIEEKCKVDVNGDQKLVRRLKKEVEQVKHSLSESMRTSLTVENINGDVDFTTSIERQTFERVCSTLFEKIIKPVEKALREARMTREVIDEVILIGGSTRIPKVQSILQEFFNGKKLNKSLHPLQAVATGAAFHAAMLSGDITIAPDALLLDVLYNDYCCDPAHSCNRI